MQCFVVKVCLLCVRENVWRCLAVRAKTARDANAVAQRRRRKRLAQTRRETEALRNAERRRERRRETRETHRQQERKRHENREEGEEQTGSVTSTPWNRIQGCETKQRLTPQKLPSELRSK